MKLDKENNWRRRVLSAEEEPRLLRALPKRLRPLAVVALHTGEYGSGELLALTWKDIEFRELHHHLSARPNPARD